MQYRMDFVKFLKSYLRRNVKIYNSSGEAERETGICARNIRSACSGHYKTAGGYHWKWA